MPCCGQMRAQASAGGRAFETRGPRPVSQVALYEYTGATGMTVTGPVSGKRYRFAEASAKVQIDARDVASLAGLPNLRRLR
jgi:hypothetical protein